MRISTGCPKKTHFQNHSSPQAWLAGSKQPRVSLQLGWWFWKCTLYSSGINAVWAGTFRGFLNISLRTSGAQLGFDSYSNTTITMCLIPNLCLIKPESFKDNVRSHGFLCLKKSSFFVTHMGPQLTFLRKCPFFMTHMGPELTVLRKCLFFVTRDPLEKVITHWRSWESGHFCHSRGAPTNLLEKVIAFCFRRGGYQSRGGGEY